MQYDVETGGRHRHVTVRRAGDGFAVSVDGRLHQVDFARIDAHTLSLIVDTDVSGGPQGARRSVHEATVGPDTDGSLVVLIGSVPVVVSLNDRRFASRRRRGAASGSGPLRIAAPMPGRIVRVLVKAGDAVRARQPVVVVEAMKMENELRADRDGTVAEIHVREGMSVDAGALLVVIQ